MTVLLPADADTRTSPVFDLAAHGDRTALWTEDGRIGYADLAARAGDLAGDVLGPARRLVLVEGGNRPGSVVAYLSALQHGHAALLVPHGRDAQLAAMVEAYDPDVVLRPDDGDGVTATVRRDGTAHDLHPDLALLLSTSGSTGSPKLVRLSRENLRANAASIASYLELTADDRAATSLPLHYCYGLSVLNSHLVVGGGLVLTELSVVDECFWDRFGAAGATSFAGVPYTFDLLDRSGFEHRDLPTLRYVTQAGGRMAPDRVRQFAELGRRRGWDLYVMYGQTEATARMAYLPPTLAGERPGAVGVAVPGGRLRVDPVPECAEPGVGELVYSGPNVMMGYAGSPADLARGAEVTELRTGDLAREVDGLLEVVGRRNRHAKVFGLRIDLDRVERGVAASVGEVRCVALDETLHVFTNRPRSRDAVASAVRELCGLPPAAVRVHELGELPVTATGKPDHGALLRQARLADAAGPGGPADPAREGRTTAEAVRDELALVLGRPDARTDDSFVALGGDSLSYVELATRLDALLGDLPPSWHTRSAAELAAYATPRRRTVATDTTVLLRALGILLIVGTHANLLTVTGGAHLLLAVAGFNLARFHLGRRPLRERLRHGLASLAQVAVPSGIFIGAVAVTSGMYDAPTAVFLNGLLGSDGWTVQWQFWFLEALLWGSAGLVCLMALPWVDRLDRRAPFGLPLAVLGATLVLRYAWTGVEAGATERYTLGVVLWFLVLGWLVARATTLRRRLLVLVVAATAVAGFFGDPQRELVVLAGVVVMALLPQVRLPRPLSATAAVLAGASLSIYLTHWQVYPHLEWDHPLLATALSLVVGVAYAWLTRPLSRLLGRVTR